MPGILPSSRRTYASGVLREAVGLMLVVIIVAGIYSGILGSAAASPFMFAPICPRIKMPASWHLGAMFI